MTIRERLQIIGQVLTGNNPVKEVVREVEAKQKMVAGGFLQFNNMGLSNEKKVSAKVLEANKGWVYRNNDVIAKEVATIEFELFKVKFVGGEIVYDPILSHPLLDALDRFNEFTDSSTGFYITDTHYNLAGDSFWYIDGAGPNIKGIYILQPDKVELKFGDVTRSQRIISGYLFKDTVDGETINETYEPEEIIHFKSPNAKNPYRGLGKVEAAADAIDTDTLAIEANKLMFERGLISNFVLTSDKKLTPEQLQQLHSEFKATYGGVDNAFKVPIFGSGLKPETVQLTSKEVEFIAQQTWVRDKITSIFGNSKAVIGVTEDVNRANAEATIINWKRTTVRSSMKALTDTLNEFLVPRFGDGLVLGFKDPVPEDETEKIDKATALKGANIITLNESREILGLDPVKGGDDFPTPTQPVIELPKALAHVKLSPVLRRSGVYKEKARYDQIKKLADKKAREIVRKRKERAKEEPVESVEHMMFSNEQVWDFHNKQINVVETQELVFYDKVKSYIDTLVDRALQQIPDEYEQMQKKQLLDIDDELVRATIDLTPILNEVAIIAGQQALNFINSEDTYLARDVRKTIEANVRKFTRSMIETDRELMIDILAQGVANGDSVPKIRRAITAKFDEFSKVQAERITRTEVIRTSNLGTMDAWEQSGMVTGKQWLTAMDDRVDPLCEYMNGKIVDLRKNYFNKGQTLEVGENKTEFGYGSIKVPPLHPNCRCTLLPVLIGGKEFDAQTYLKIKGLEQDKEDLEAKIDKRSKKFKDIVNKNLELEEYVKELEAYLDE